MDKWRQISNTFMANFEKNLVVIKVTCTDCLKVLSLLTRKVYLYIQITETKNELKIANEN